MVRRVADKHANLHRNRAAFDEIEGILTGQDIVVKDQGSLEPQVVVPELLISGDDVVIDIDLPANHGVQVTVRDEYGHVVDSRVPKMSRGHAQAVVTGLPPGGYTVDVTGISIAAPVAPISSGLVIWDPTAA